MKTLILGLDAFDPKMFERLSGQGRLPHLTGYADRQGYAPFEVANPPQSEVSWTSIATGLNPGQHGIFDFVHRDPATYTPYVSLLPTQKKLGGTQFVPPHTARTLFEEATRQGYPATVLWWPATFPARPELAVRTLPGLGTPDILGRLGVGTLFTSDPANAPDEGKTPVVALTAASDGYVANLTGPARKKRGGTQYAEIPLRLENVDAQSARLHIGDQTLDLAVGAWSPILELTFKLGLWAKVGAVTRVILTQTRPDVRLYVMPLQIHPLHTPWRYASPKAFAKRVWRDEGPFLTLGMPQDTTALEDGCIDDAQFLDLCESIVAGRERVLMRQLEHFDEGVMASVFDSLDRIQHMFWSTRHDVVETWYEKLDALVGRVDARLQALGQADTRVVIVSDHGIAEFRHKVHLNRWLIAEGYLVPKSEGPSGTLKDVDWSKSRAYAVGLNSLYLNMAGRESQGIVEASQALPLLDRLKAELTAWRGPDGEPVVHEVWRKDEAFEGPYSVHGPDLVMGYHPGYRASSETGLGHWEANAITTNPDHWGADHCMAYTDVPGVVFCNQGLGDVTAPSYRDFPRLAIGVQPTPQKDITPPPPQAQDEDEQAVEERLKSLGYL
jgi:predicted AlkP superfamily phosphohydrolase/phosphomutase